MSNINISTNFCGLEMNSPFMNASGAKCTIYDELSSLDKSTCGAYISKSCTPDFRGGNPRIRYWDNETLSINSMGLYNHGIQTYLDYSHYISNTKPFFLSLAGLNLEDNMKMIYEYLNFEENHLISGLELNFSCPNIIGKGQLGYDFEAIDEYLRKIFETNLSVIPKGKLAIGIKLPPYYEPTHIETVSDILQKYMRLDFITCINSVANGLVIDTDSESVVIQPKKGLGGIGGSVVKPVALANVNQFYRNIGNRISIIGCGGISSGDDAFQHILAGASVVSVGTQLMREGVLVFDRLNDELRNIMEYKNYKRLSDFKGQLKFLEPNNDSYLY